VNLERGPVDLFDSSRTSGSERPARLGRSLYGFQRRVNPLARFSAVGIILIISSITVTACSVPFGSDAQRRSFDEMSKQMAQMHDQSKANSKTLQDHNGIMAVFDTNNEAVTAKYVVRGETPQSAMSALVDSSSVTDPCVSDGPKPRVVGFAPPDAVDLPISFLPCSTVRDQVRSYRDQIQLHEAQERALRNLLSLSVNNRKGLDRLGAGMAKISNIQEVSWTRALEILTELSRNIQRGERQN
jgi:hypothetical protein